MMMLRLINRGFRQAAALVTLAVAAIVKADIYPDGSCPIIALLPFTTRRFACYTTRKSKNLTGITFGKFSINRFSPRYEVKGDIKRAYPTQYNPWSLYYASQIAHSFAAGVLLAVDHFNNRDASVVPEIAEIDDECTVYFPDPTFANSRVESKSSVREVWNATKEGENLPCAILGPLIESSNLDLRSTLLALDDIPMVTYHPEIDALASKESTGTITMTLSAASRAKAMVRYLQARDFLSVYHTEADQEALLAEAINTAGKEFSLQASIFIQQRPPPGVTEEDFARETLSRMKQNGITTIFVSVAAPEKLPGFAILLEQLEMLAPEYVFILPPSLVPTDSNLELTYGKHFPGSPLDKLLTGALVFDRLDGFIVNDKNPFLKSWRMQATKTVDRLNSLVPVRWLKVNPDYFQKSFPTNGTSFIYDAVMSIGFGACEKQRMDREGFLDNDIPEEDDEDDDDNKPPAVFELRPGFEFASSPPIVSPAPSRTATNTPFQVTENPPSQPRADDLPENLDGSPSAISVSPIGEIGAVEPTSMPIETVLEVSPSPTQKQAPRSEAPVRTPVSSSPAFESPVSLAPSLPVSPLSEAPKTAFPVLSQPITKASMSPVSESSNPTTKAPLSEPAMTTSPISSVPTTRVPVSSSPTVANPSTSVPGASMSETPSGHHWDAPAKNRSSFPLPLPTDNPSLTLSDAPISTSPFALRPSPITFPPQSPSSSPPTNPSTKPSDLPSGSPSSSPPQDPTESPTTLSTGVSTMLKPSGLPSLVPTETPSRSPSRQQSSPVFSAPFAGPSEFPASVTASPFGFSQTDSPSQIPSSLPTLSVSGSPSSTPSMSPSKSPGVSSSVMPSEQPSPVLLPSISPSKSPTGQPNNNPMLSPLDFPSSSPSETVSSFPSQSPNVGTSSLPSTEPRIWPTALPSSNPSDSVSAELSVYPSEQPTGSPEISPTGYPSLSPSSMPTLTVSGSPSSRPSTSPSRSPRDSPSQSPSSLPSEQPSPMPLPSVSPSRLPTGQPNNDPTLSPSEAPSSSPSETVSTFPSEYPSRSPSASPSDLPSVRPSNMPTALPSSNPSKQLSAHPSESPTALLSTDPTGSPTRTPSGSPSATPSGLPTTVPSGYPSIYPTGQPSMFPSGFPSGSPTSVQTAKPSSLPSDQPSRSPSLDPSIFPSDLPSAFPSAGPSNAPIGIPSEAPNSSPSASPSREPSSSPTVANSVFPSEFPSDAPSSFPSMQLSSLPTTTSSDVPTWYPSGKPSSSPSGEPIGLPSESPSLSPSGSPTRVPSASPSGPPSATPSGSPTDMLSFLPSTYPSEQPSGSPSAVPSGFPTERPSSLPTGMPSSVPSDQPSAHSSASPSDSPTSLPSINPSGSPTRAPSDSPSTEPSGSPSSEPTELPTNLPSVTPTAIPSTRPSSQPSFLPSLVPSRNPTDDPSDFPSTLPSSSPSGLPSNVQCDLTVTGVPIGAGAFTQIKNGPPYLPDGSTARLEDGKTYERTSYAYTYSGSAIEFTVNCSTGILDVSADFCAMSIEADPGTTVDILSGPQGQEDGDSVELPIDAAIDWRPVILGVPGAYSQHNVNSCISALNASVRRLLQSTEVSPRISRGTLLQGILKSNFRGASGPVSFRQDDRKARNRDNIMVGLYNIHPKPLSNETGKRSYSAILTSTYEEGRGWQDIPGAVVLYRDGTTTTPAAFRRIFHHNYISSSVRTTGLVFMGVAWLIAFILLVLVGWLRQDPVVQSAQPALLQLLCVGSIITSAAIFTLSWDEGAGWTDQKLDVACILTPWFFFVGHIVMFCSLITKLWRLDHVLHFRQRVGSFFSGVWLYFTLVAASLTLLVVHTVIDPWTWNRDLIRDLPSETYGHCTSKYTWAFFGPLVAMIFLAQLVTMYFAWKTKDLQEDFRGSGAVMYACLAQLQAWAIGCPMLVLLGFESIDASYFAKFFLIWIFAVSSVVLVVGSKVYKAIKIRRHPEFCTERRGRRNSLSGRLYKSESELTLQRSSAHSRRFFEGSSGHSREFDLRSSSSSLGKDWWNRIKEFAEDDDSTQSPERPSVSTRLEKPTENAVILAAAKSDSIT